MNVIYERLMDNTYDEEVVPEEVRFQSLDDRVLADVSWINLLPKKDTLVMVPPREVPSNLAYADEYTGSSESYSSTVRDDPIVIENVNRLLLEYKYKRFRSDYRSKPFLDSVYYSKIEEQRKIMYTSFKDRISFIKISNIRVDNPKSYGVYRIFTYSKNVPLSEVFVYHPSKQANKLRSYLSTYSEAYLPYLVKSQSFIVALFNNYNSEDEVPVGIGLYLISSREIRQTTSFRWFEYKPERSLQDFIETYNILFCADSDDDSGSASSSRIREVKVFPYVQFDIDIVEKPPKRGLVHLTAFSNFYPTPLLTISNVSFDIQNASRDLRFFVLYSLRRKVDSEIVPLSHTRVFPLQLNDTDKNSIVICVDSKTKRHNYAYSSKVKVAKKVYLHEPINFYLPTSNENLELLVEVVTVVEKRLKVIADTVIHLDRPRQTYKNETKIKMRSKKLIGAEQFELACDVLFPSIISPPQDIKIQLIAPLTHKASSIKRDFLNDEMFQDIAPYILQFCFGYLFSIQNDFSQIHDIVCKCSDKWLFYWVQTCFIIPPFPGTSFLDLMIDFILKNLAEFKEKALFYFALLAKALFINRDDKIICKKTERFFSELSKIRTHLGVTVDIGRFLILFRAIFNIETNVNSRHGVLVKCMYKYMYNLPLLERVVVYNAILCDIGFIISQIPLESSKNFSFRKSLGIYVPFYSLYFSSIRMAFLSNDKELIEYAISSIGSLGLTLELYLPAERERNLAITSVLFPLFTLIYTFYDSLTLQFGDKLPSLYPALLYIIKNTTDTEIINNSFYDLLLVDNKQRFLDFFNIVTSSRTLKKFADGLYILESENAYRTNIVTMVYSEISQRVLNFLSIIIRTREWYVIEEEKRVDVARDSRLSEGELSVIVSIFVNLLDSKQDKKTFEYVFGQLLNLISIFKTKIFSEPTHIFTLMPSIVDITQRASLRERCSSIACILSIMEIEERTRNNYMMSLHAIQYSIVKYYFENKSLYNFQSINPNRLEGIFSFAEKMREIDNNSLLYFEIGSRLAEERRKIKNFPSLNYLLLSYIVKLYEENNDLFSAFYVQWSLCALICESFRIRSKVVEEYPDITALGAKIVPIVGESEVVNLNDLDEETISVRTECQFFTIDNLKKQLIKTLDYCQRVGLYWLTGVMSELLFVLLERQREFSTLSEVNKSIGNAYLQMNKRKIMSSQAGIHMFLVSVRGELARSFGMYENTDRGGWPLEPNYIIVTGLDSEEKLRKLFKNVCHNVKFAHQDPLLLTEIKTFTESIVQIVKLDVDNDIFGVDSMNYSAQKFYVNVKKSKYNIDEADWQHQIGTRYTLETKDPIPHNLRFMSSVQINRNKVESFIITKSRFYSDCLTEYARKALHEVNCIKAVLPKSSKKINLSILNIVINQKADSKNDLDGLSAIVFDAMSLTPEEAELLENKPLVFFNKCCHQQISDIPAEVRNAMFKLQISLLEVILLLKRIDKQSSNVRNKNQDFTKYLKKIEEFAMLLKKLSVDRKLI